MKKNKKIKKFTKTLCFQIDNQTYLMLEKISRSEERSISQVARRILNQNFKKNNLIPVKKDFLS